MSGPLRVDRPADGVVLLTLDLPERRNAMTEELTDAWRAAIAEIATDRSVRVVVVTGEGKAFCAGGDLSWLGEGDGSNGPAPIRLRDRMLPFYRTWLSIRELEVPTIAALNGAAIGAGLCLALGCDLRYATPEAKLAMPFTALGMHPGMAATYLLPEAVGLPRAREMLFTGRVLTGEQAASIGLVNDVFPAERLLDEVLDIAGKAAATAPIATRLTKRAMQHGPRSFVEALEWEALAQPVTLASQDLREGLRAQAERRTPVFRGL
ncbi:MAG TPA: enoyl-CoA hydratase-related protein [Frankiaceae bacterium]|nr:enoyl-CoA hydratase-related protein [Frankiaceae bacterium]